MGSRAEIANAAPGVRLTLPAALAGLITEEGLGEGGAGLRSVALAPGSWRDVADEIAGRFPRLAGRLLDDRGGVAPGFVLVLGDEVVADVRSLDLRAGDRIYLIPSLAGG